MFISNYENQIINLVKWLNIWLNLNDKTLKFMNDDFYLFRK